MWAKQQKQSGFTIVELLIVIVVIAILAAISIVAYNGIQSRARASAASAALVQAQKKILIALSDGTLSSYPQNQSGFEALNIPTNDVVYQYSILPSNPSGYCITATSGSVSYKITESGQPSSGSCGMIITNYATNPSVESNITSWTGVNGATATRQTASALFGSQGVQITTSNTVDSGVQIPTSGLTVATGTSYTASVSIRALTAASYSLSVQGVGGTASRNIQTLSAGQTSRFTLTWTPSTSGTVAFYALKQGSQAGSFTFDVDGAMLVANSTASTYSDGYSLGWDWNSTPNNSSSFGPAP